MPQHFYWCIREYRRERSCLVIVINMQDNRSLYKVSLEENTNKTERRTNEASRVEYRQDKLKMSLYFNEEQNPICTYSLKPAGKTNHGERN